MKPLARLIHSTNKKVIWISTHQNSQLLVKQKMSPLYQACVDQGNVVRDLKTKKADKNEVLLLWSKKLDLCFNCLN